MADDVATRSAAERIDLRAVETWFRRRGLPLVVRRRVRGTAIVQRSTPAMVFVLLIDPLLSGITALVDVPREQVERQVDNPVFVIGLLALAVAALVVPVLAGWLTSRWLRATGPTGRFVIAWTVFALNVPVLPVVEKLTGLRELLWTNIAVDLVSLLLLFFLVYVGAGSILGWGLRHAARQLGTIGTMATRALPLLVLVVIFSFFATEVWQVANSLRRWQLWLAVAFLALLAVLFMVSVLNDELKQMAGRIAERGDGVDELIVGTPVAGARDVPLEPHPLSRSERANITLVLFVAQAMQVVLLSTLVFCLFLVLGILTMRRDVIASWLQVRPDELQTGVLFGMQIGVPNVLVQVSIFLSAFSALYFAASAATDPQYRKSFFDPLLDDVRVSLAARQVYLAHRPQAA